MIAVGTVRSKGGSKFVVEVGEDGSLTITDVLAVGADGVLNMSDFLKEDIDALKKAASENWGAFFSDYDSADATTSGADFDPYMAITNTLPDEFTVNFANGGKEYREVKKIVLGNMVSFFSAEGWQFPNVSSVLSESFRFKTTSLSKQGFAGIVYAVEKTYLLNVFNYKNTIDISGVGQISADAFVKGTDTGSLVFKNVSPGMSIVSSMPSFVKRASKAKRLDPSNTDSDVFKHDAGLYWYGNIIVSTDNGKIITDRKDAYILKDAAESATYLDIPDVVLLRMSEDTKRIDDRSIRLHITQELSAQFREQTEHCESGQWGYITGFVSDCEDYADEGGVLYTKDFKKLVLCPPNIQAKTDTLRIHKGTEVIGREAFRFAHIKRIIMPDSVKHLESSAFSYCFVKDIKLSGGLSAIENETMALPGQFQGCDNLKRVSIPASVKYIADKSFYNCLALEDVNFEEGAAETIGRGAFHNTKIKSVELPKSCKRVGECAFAMPHGMVAAHTGTKGVAGSAYNGRFEYTNIPVRFALIKDDGERQELLVPVEVLRSEKVRAGIDIAFCKGDIPCALSELIFDTAMDRIQGTYNKSRLALMAVSQYGSTNGHIIKYLKKAGPYLAERLIGDGNIKELSELLHMHFLPNKALEKLLSISSDKGNVEGAALIAEEIRRKNTRKKTEIIL